MTEPGTPGGAATDEPAEGSVPGDGDTVEPELRESGSADGGTEAPHPTEPAEGDRPESAQDAP